MKNYFVLALLVLGFVVTTHSAELEVPVINDRFHLFFHLRKKFPEALPEDRPTWLPLKEDKVLALLLKSTEDAKVAEARQAMYIYVRDMLPLYFSKNGYIIYPEECFEINESVGMPTETYSGQNEQIRRSWSRLAGLLTGAGLAELTPVVFSCAVNRSFAPLVTDKWSVVFGCAALELARRSYEPSKKGKNLLVPLAQTAAGTAGLYAAVKYGPGLVTTFLK